MMAAVRTDPTGQQELLAQLNWRHFRRLKAAGLRFLVAASAPVWLQAWSGALPDLLAFWALLAQGAGLILTLFYAGLEHQWRRRAARLEGAVGPRIHDVWGDLDELRAGLWAGLGLVSMVPWCYVASGRPLPAALFAAALGTFVATLLLLLAAGSAPRPRSSLPE
jgi:hypothetical protein